jgi:cytochrome c
MPKVTDALLLAVVGISVITYPAVAQRGTPAEAKAMLAKAVAHYQAVGRGEALADFTAKKAPFADRDLYVFCIGPNRVISAHGATASLVGTSADALKDADGKPLGKAILDAAAGKDGGWVRYRWTNPVSGKTEPKVSFVQKVGTDVCGVGAYEAQGR